METLKLIVRKQRISANDYVVPSGNRDVYTLEAEFQNSDWDEFTKFAVFYRDDDPENVHDVIMKDNHAEIPPEMTAKPGSVRAGVLGRLDGKTLMATDLMKINVIKGTPTDTIEPSPTVYEQILDDYAIINTKLKEQTSRLDLVLSNGSTDGELKDIRYKIDGTTSDLAGNAVRDQILALRDNLISDIKDVAVDDYSRIVYDIDGSEIEVLTMDDVKEIAEQFKSVVKYEVCFNSLTNAQKAELKGEPGAIKFTDITEEQKAEWLSNYQTKLIPGDGISITEDGVISSIVYPEATSTQSGLMSASDKSKLDTLYNYFKMVIEHNE